MIAIVNGQNHYCALSSAGVVSCWGGNSTGQLGVAPGSADGGYEMVEGEEPDIPQCPNGSCRPTAAAVTKLPLAKQLSAYGDSNCIVTEDDDVMCWGRLAEGATPRTIDGPW